MAENVRIANHGTTEEGGGTLAVPPLLTGLLVSPAAVTSRGGSGGGGVKWLEHGWLRTSMDPPSPELGGLANDGIATHKRSLSWNCRRSGKISPTRNKGSNKKT